MADYGPIKAFLFDVDGAIMVQGGPFHKPIVDLGWALMNELKLPMGPASGKSFDYLRALALSFGKHFPFVSAENGAIWATLKAENPPAWHRVRAAGGASEDLWLFQRQIRLDPWRERFLLGRRMVDFRPEAKEAIFTLFPPGNDIAVSTEWVPYFESVIQTHQLELYVKRHGDGAVDVVPIGITKKLAVDRVCKLVGCQPTEILTLVDGVNDWELAEGTSCIAVGNAHPQLKELVENSGELGFVAKQEHGFGLAQGLLHFAWLGRLPVKTLDLVRKAVPEVEDCQ